MRPHVNASTPNIARFAGVETVPWNVRCWWQRLTGAAVDQEGGRPKTFQHCHALASYVIREVEVVYYTVNHRDVQAFPSDSPYRLKHAVCMD